VSAEWVKTADALAGLTGLHVEAHETETAHLRALAGGDGFADIDGVLHRVWMEVENGMMRWRLAAVEAKS